MMFWFIVVAVAVVLFALAWWSSGRAKRRPGRPDPGDESRRGWATKQAVVHRDGGFSGPAG